MKKNIRPIAIYLPQFYPTPENDEWWGMGFTEWTNVAKAKPRFSGHYQPHLPADLGFYDLRVPEVRELQAQLAKEYGIYGFCYYHYWFNGRRILERPVNEILESKKPDFPFMLCWANENWTRCWVSKKTDILLKQNYNLEDDRNHIQYLINNVFKDPRYIRIDNKPVFAIYRSTHIPHIEQTLKLWREEAAKEEMELYLCRFEAHNFAGKEYLAQGFDAAVEFQPHAVTNLMQDKTIGTRIINKVTRTIFKKKVKATLLSYPQCVDYMCKQPMPEYKRYPCVMPMWDNSSRNENGFLAFKNSSPQLYYKWLKYTIENFVPYSTEENFLFLNAWNEWAEGNHLEPCRKWGRAYLEYTKKAIVE